MFAVDVLVPPAVEVVWTVASEAITLDPDYLIRLREVIVPDSVGAIWHSGDNVVG
jgi:hypothetical protein